MIPRQLAGTDSLGDQQHLGGAELDELPNQDSGGGGHSAHHDDPPPPDERGTTLGQGAPYVVDRSLTGR